jgi:isocitrate lyase
MDKTEAAKALGQAWRSQPRWQGIFRPYSAEDVIRLRGSVDVQHTIAGLGAARLWDLLHTEPYVHALGAITGNQAVQQVLAGLKAIYASGWQVAADANNAGETYPDQSLYPADSVPTLVKRINNALLRADQIQETFQLPRVHWLAPIVADGEAGFGGPLNAFELTKAMIDAGAAAVHFEDQLSSLKKCGHMGGKVLVPSSEFLRKFTAARLATDIVGVPTLLVARTDAHSAKLLRSDIDPVDHPFLTGRKEVSGSPSPERSLTRLTPMSSGARLRPRTSGRPVSLPRLFRNDSRASSSPTTALPPLIGDATWTNVPSAGFKRTSARWGTSFSS